MKINEMLITYDNKQLLTKGFCQEVCKFRNDITKKIFNCLELWCNMNWWETNVHECNIHWSCKIKINNIK